jgi:hypothetical protein
LQAKIRTKKMDKQINLSDMVRLLNCKADNVGM